MAENQLQNSCSDLLYDKTETTESKVSPATELQNWAKIKTSESILSSHHSVRVHTEVSPWSVASFASAMETLLFSKVFSVLHTCCFPFLNTPLPPLLLLHTSVTVAYFMFYSFHLSTFGVLHFITIHLFSLFLCLCMFVVVFFHTSITCHLSLLHDRLPADCRPFSPASRHVVSSISRAYSTFWTLFLLNR